MCLLERLGLDNFLGRLFELSFFDVVIDDYLRLVNDFDLDYLDRLLFDGLRVGQDG